MKTLLRIVRRDTGSFVLNLLGIALGIACFVCLQLYVANERSYDEFHANSDELYRISIYANNGDREYRSAIVHGVWENYLENEITGVKKATKLMRVQNDITFQTEKGFFNIPENTGFYSDHDFLDIFKFDLLHGSRDNLLNNPGDMVITESMAKRLFNATDVVGEVVKLDFGEEYSLQISGVIKDIPVNSHIQFDYLLAGSTFSEMWEAQGQYNPGSYTVYVYFESYPDVRINTLQNQISSLAVDRFERFNADFLVQTVTDLHFEANALFEHTKPGNKSFVGILDIISYFILFIAIINYVILSSSQLFNRSKEVGVKKTLGANRLRIFLSLLKEAILMTVLGGFISILFSYMIMLYAFPLWFDIELSLFDNYRNVIYILLLSVGVGILAGLIPSLQISSLSLIPSLKGQVTKGGSLRQLNTYMVTVQFIFTIIIVMGTNMVLKQVNYLKNKDLGYNKEAAVNISRPSGIPMSQWIGFMNNVNSLTFVQSSGTTMYDFIGDYNGAGASIITENDTIGLTMQWNPIDEGIVETLDLELLEGRNFNKNLSTDSSGVILNHAAARKFGVENIVGRTILSSRINGGKGKVIGIVKDFHFQAFNKEVVPVLMTYQRNNGWKRNFLVRFNTQEYDQVLSSLENVWKESGIIVPFEFAFIDQWFGKLIDNEERLSNLIFSFSIISLIVSCLGLIGLIRFTMNREMKNIGIRKVFGASVHLILLSINRKFFVSVAIACLIALPLAYLGIEKWLENFAYGTTQTILDYLLGISIICLITVLVITVQSWKTAHLNPVNVLKDE